RRQPRQSCLIQNVSTSLGQIPAGQQTLNCQPRVWGLCSVLVWGPTPSAPQADLSAPAPGSHPLPGLLFVTGSPHSNGGKGVQTNRRETCVRSRWLLRRRPLRCSAGLPFGRPMLLQGLVRLVLPRRPRTILRSIPWPAASMAFADPATPWCADCSTVGVPAVAISIAEASRPA